MASTERLHSIHQRIIATESAFTRQLEVIRSTIHATLGAAALSGTEHLANGGSIDMVEGCLIIGTVAGMCSAGAQLIVAADNRKDLADLETEEQAWFLNG